MDTWYFQTQWSHVLAEPLIQIGPGGPVITVERHCLVLGAGCVVAGLLQQQGYVWLCLRNCDAFFVNWCLN